MKPLGFDVFCGAGGCTDQRAGFEMWGCDVKDQPRYCGERFFQADALELLADLEFMAQFVFVSASPTCQHYSKLGKDGNPDLIAETRELLEATGLPYVIENIEDARSELRDPVLLCGTMFDPPLDGLKRHRLFETNWPLSPPSWPCRHKLAAPRFRVYEHGHWYLSPFVKVYGSGGGKARDHWPAALEIDWMTDAEMKEAIPPRYTEHVGTAFMRHIRAKAVA